MRKNHNTPWLEEIQETKYLPLSEFGIYLGFHIERPG